VHVSALKGGAIEVTLVVDDYRRERISPIGFTSEIVEGSVSLARGLERNVDFMVASFLLMACGE